MILQHEQRWAAAKKLFQSLLDAAKSQPDYMLMYEDEVIEREQIRISEEGIHVEPKRGTKIIWFELDPEWDHGLHTSIEDFEKEVRANFKLIKVLAW